MKYYLVPIEELRTFDEKVNNFLKTMYPKIYSLYRVNCKIDKTFLEILNKNNLPTHILFHSKQFIPKKK